MPEIGRPEQGRNSFSKISMTSESKKNNYKQTKGQKNSVSDELNRLAGARRDQKFVDRASHNKLGKDGFLKLLAHQLKNQDPLKPADQKQFAADLAQFSQLEQLRNMNTKFDKLSTNIPHETKFMGASFLGKEVQTKGASLYYNGSDNQVGVPFHLDKFAKNIFVNIYDKKGQLTSRLEAKNVEKGQHTLSWNAKGFNNYFVGKGDYHFEVFGEDKNLEKFKAETKGSGLVKGVRFQGDKTILTLESGKEISLRDVISFRLPIKKEKVDGKNIRALKNDAVSRYTDMNESI